MAFIIFGVAIISGIVQGVTGFAGGIILMMVLPLFFALPQSAGISSAICMILSATMIYQYKKHVSPKKIILPCVLFLMTTSITITFSTMVDQVLMKKVFGVFLLCLCAYYLFFNQKKVSHLSLPVSLFCIVFSGICDGLFGIGGPLMVLYFMANTDDSLEYLATTQLFFMTNNIYNTGFRIVRGILLPEHLFIILFGIAGIVLGGMIAKRVVDKLNEQVLRKLTYIMIGISGLTNIL